MTPLPELSRGSHSRLDGGLCLLELVSVCAGAHFSDRPPGVSPTVGAFLRGYNDGLDDRLRQDLRPLADDLVGSARDPRTEAARAEHCRRRLRSLYGRRITWMPAGRAPEAQLEVCGYRAGRSAADETGGRRHRETLKLVSELLRTGGTPAHATQRHDPEPAGR